MPERYPARHIPIQLGLKSLRAEFFEEDDHSGWRIWLAANRDFTLGHFIELRDDGKMHKVTWHEDGSVSMLDVTDDWLTRDRSNRGATDKQDSEQ
jgi:hypothetical protein